MLIEKRKKILPLFSIFLQNIRIYLFMNTIFKDVLDLVKELIFSTNSNFPLQPDGVNLWYFKLRLFDVTEFSVWNI